MGISDITLNPQDEYDFSNDGIQERELTFDIVDFEVEAKENGDRAAITFKNDELPFPVTVREWMKHSNPKAQEIGRGNLKRISIAATGKPSFSRTTLIGSKVKATVADDGRGFTTLKRFKTAEATHQG